MVRLLFLLLVIPALLPLDVHAGIELRATLLSNYDSLLESRYGLQNNDLVELEQLDLPEEEFLILFELAKAARLPHAELLALKTPEKQWIDIIHLLDLTLDFLPQASPQFLEEPISDEEIVDLLHTWFVLQQFDCLPVDALSLRGVRFQEFYPAYAPEARLKDQIPQNDGREESARQRRLHGSERLVEQEPTAKSPGPRVFPRQVEISSKKAPPSTIQPDSPGQDRASGNGRNPSQTGRQQLSEEELFAEYRASLQASYGFHDAQWEHLRRENFRPEELLLTLQIAEKAAVEVHQVIERRDSHQSWLEVAVHFGLSAEQFYIPQVHAHGTVLQAVFNRYETHPRETWNTLQLSDWELVQLAKLQFLSEQCDCSADEILSQYPRLGDLLLLHHAVKK